ncbi:MAG: exo-alpha-sialidase [Chthoniobacteraceae bacterium]
MKLAPFLAIVATSLIIASVLAPGLRAQIPGGFGGLSMKDPDALAAAKFAVTAHDPQLTFQAIEKVERQVVAGLNFRLTISVTESGKARSADAVVWKKLDGTHQLTSWKWLDEAHAQAGLLKSEFIYETAPFPSCHATTIVEPAAGGLVAAWFGGTAEGKPDVGIWSSRFTDEKWTAPVEVANGVQTDGTRFPCWNPVLFQPKGGALLLFYKVGPSPSKWWGMLRNSTDGGRTWSDARRLPDGILGPIKNKPVQLANGDILCPTSSEDAGWRVHFERSSDGGANWSKTDAVNDGKVIGAIQPSILFPGGEKLLAIGRTKQAHIFRIASDDGGKSWGEMSLTALPNPNSGTDAVTLRDGRHLLVYNHTAKGRTPLNLAVSRDGVVWEAALTLETVPGEYSYPAIIQTGDGLVHITYTWKRQRVRHVVIDPAQLKSQPMMGGTWP